LTFEDAVQLVHDLSNKLATLVELKGDLVMTSSGTTQAKQLNEHIVNTSLDVQFIVNELQNSGLIRILEETNEK
jgi:hypothetical protein